MSKTPITAQTFFGLDLSSVFDRLWLFRRNVSKRFLLLEFGPSWLALAQASFSEAEVQFTHLRRMALPDGAIERGVPSDPAAMATWIKELCREEHIYGHRVAVVLPPEAAFTKLLTLPAALTEDEAREFARDPASGLQIPIPLHQTDFDLVPTCLPLQKLGEQLLQTYFLTSVPQRLVDQLLQTLQQADMELHRIDLGFTAQLRLIAAETAALQPGEYLMLLELMPDCSHLIVAGASGPVFLERLAALRDFPEPVFNIDQNQAALAEALSAESITLADERYLPLSELDLRVLISELKRSMEKFASLQSPCRWKGVVLTGVNSAHPMIGELFTTGLGLPAHILHPMGAAGVGAVDFSQLLVHQGLGRLLGLGLGLLPHDALVACSLSEQVDHHLLDSSSPILPHPTPALRLLPPTAVNQFQPRVDVVSSSELQEEDAAADKKGNREEEDLEREKGGLASSAMELGQVALGEGVQEEEKEEEEEWPSLRLTLSSELQEEDAAADKKGNREEEDLEREKGGLASSAMELGQVALGEGVQEEEKEEEEEWPSLRLTLSSELQEEDAAADKKGNREEEDLEREKGGLASSAMELGQVALGEGVQEEEKEEEEEWPSLRLTLSSELQEEDAAADKKGNREEEDLEREKGGLASSAMELGQVALGEGVQEEEKEEEEEWPSLRLTLGEKLLQDGDSVN